MHAVPAESGTILPGERFTDSESGLEIVCTRAGEGILTFDDRPMQRCPEAAHQAAPWTDWKRRRVTADPVAMMFLRGPH